MEEQRARQEEERRRALAESGALADATDPVASTAAAPSEERSAAIARDTEEDLLQRALALSTETENPVKRNRVRECGFSFP